MSAVSGVPGADTLVGITPSACRWCGVEQRSHAQTWIAGRGWHGFEEPTREQIAARLRVKLTATLSARTVWQFLVSDRPIGGLVAVFPAHETWIREYADSLAGHIRVRLNIELPVIWKAAQEELPDGFSREQLAEWAGFDRWALLLMYDGRAGEIPAGLWRRSMPPVSWAPGTAPWDRIPR